MPNFVYTALSPAGERVRGELSGNSEQAVLAELEARQLTPVAIELGEDRAAASRFPGRGRVSLRKMGTAYRQLSELLHAGVPLLRSLRLLGNRKSEPRLAALFRELAEAVSSGDDLAGAMSKRPEAFPVFHVAMVRAGEKGGFLETVFARLGQAILRQAELRDSLVGNLIYPILLVVIGVGVLGALFVYFVPSFRAEIAQTQSDLPAITEFVFLVSDLVGRYGVVTLAVAAVVVIGVLRARRNPAVRRRLLEWWTMAPIVGTLTRSIAAARFCRMLGTMMSNGVPMITAMQVAKDAAGNALMQEAIERATQAVQGGQSLAPPLAESRLFEEDVVEMIAVAEQANNLEAVLVSIADTVESRVDRAMTAAVRLIGPLIIFLIAGAVLVVAVALVLPLTQIKPG